MQSLSRLLLLRADNVELFAGGIAEDTMEGARIGPTFICIIADQMKRIRDGDRSQSYSNLYRRAFYYYAIVYFVSL